MGRSGAERNQWDQGAVGPLDQFMNLLGLLRLHQKERRTPDDEAAVAAMGFEDVRVIDYVFMPDNALKRMLDLDVSLSAGSSGIHHPVFLHRQ
jgi:hypothetical protein